MKVAFTMTGRLARFSADRRGNVAMMWAVTAVAMLSLVGVSVDFSRANAAKVVLQNATDGAVLVAERMSDRPFAERKAAAEQYFSASLSELSYAGTARISIEESPEGGHVATSVITVPVTLAKLASGYDIDVRTSATADESQGPVEVALVLDNTGSMSSDMQALRDAAEDLVNTVFDAADDPELVDIALVPFVSQVNIGNGALQRSWTDEAGTAPFNGEIMEGRQLARRTWQSSHGANCQNLSTMPFTGYSGTLRVRWERGNLLDLTDPLYCYAYAPDDINHHELHDLVQGSSWKGCVEARPEPFDINDDPPNPANPATMFVPYFWVDNIDGLPNSYISDSAGNISGATMYGSQSGSGYSRAQQGRYFSPFKYRNSNSTPDSSPPDTSGPNRGCPTPIVPLTSNRNTVIDAVRAMRHWNGGGTNQTEGLAWGWRVLSPGAPFTEGAPYGEKRKVLVLMSDGQNTNVGTGSSNNPIMGSDYSSYSHLSQWTPNTFLPFGWRDFLPLGFGRNGITSSSAYVNYINTREGQLCTAIKAQGIEIFTVMFRETNGTARDIMRNCASPDANGVVHYHTADNQAELQAAFEEISVAIGKLRLLK